MASRLVVITAATRSALAVQLGGDGIGDVGKLLLLLLKVLSDGSSSYCQS